MKAFRAFGALLLFCCAAATGQTVTVSAQHLGGATPVTGSITFQPVLADGATQASVHLYGGGITSRQPLTTVVTAGAFTLNNVVDTGISNPANLCYNVTVHAQNGLQVLGPGFTCVQPATNNAWCSSGVCSFDAYVPALAPLVPTSTGPMGPTGAPGVSSLAQLAAVRVKGPLGTANLFNAATTQVGYVNNTNGTINAGGSGFTASDYIPVNSGGPMVSSGDLMGSPGGGGGAYYDQGLNFISGWTATIPGGTVFTPPATAAFMRVTFSPTPPATEMIVNGSTLPASYGAFGTYAPNQVDAKIAAVSSGAATLSGSALARFKSNPSANYYNAAATTYGYVNSNTGQLVSSAGDTAFTTTDFIPANAGGFMATSAAPVVGAAGICFYDQSGAYQSCSTTQPGAGGNFAVPSGAAFVRLSYQTGDATGLFIAYGQAVPQTYQTFGGYAPNQIDAKDAAVAASIGGVSNQIVRATQPLLVNLFDPSRATSNALLHTGLSYTGAAGTSEASTGAYISDFMPVAAGQTYTMSPGDGDTNNGYGLVWYDVNRSPLSAVGYPFTNGQTFTAPANAVWARFTMAQGAGNIATQMFTTGTTVPSAYVHFGQVPITSSDLIAAASPAMASTLKGKNVFFWGDSISSIFQNKWQLAFIARTGANYYGQDARPGRTWGSMLEGYGVPCPVASLSSIGTYNPATTYSNSPCTYGYGGTLGGYGTPSGSGGSSPWTTVPTAGQTLAQVLANVDVLVIVLGTNDAGVYGGQPGSYGTVGNLSDAYTAGTEMAAMNFALDAIFTAKPTVRVVIVTPYLVGNNAPTTGTASSNADGSGSTLVITQGSAAAAALGTLQAEVQAEVNEGASRGVPVLNMLTQGNVNYRNSNKQTRDTTHPTDAYAITVMGPTIAQFTMQQN